MPCDAIELMVAHDSQGIAGIDHAAHSHYAVNLARPAVDEVTHKYGLAIRIWVSKTASLLPVAQVPQEAVELVRLAVYVPDDVVSHEVLQTVSGTMKLL
jgi:hypothetical protein